MSEDDNPLPYPKFKTFSVTGTVASIEKGKPMPIEEFEEPREKDLRYVIAYLEGLADSGVLSEQAYDALQKPIAMLKDLIGEIEE